MGKGNLLESPLPNPIRTSEVWRYRAIAIHEDQAEWTCGCKIQSTFCWPCSMPQEKGGPLIHRHQLLTQGVLPSSAQAPFSHLPNGVASPQHSLPHSSFAIHNQHCILLIWVCVPVRPLPQVDPRELAIQVLNWLI